jgi:hypothetical protein
MVVRDRWHDVKQEGVWRELGPWMQAVVPMAGWDDGGGAKGANISVLILGNNTAARLLCLARLRAIMPSYIEVWHARAGDGTLAEPCSSSFAKPLKRNNRHTAIKVASARCFGADAPRDEMEPK